MKVSKESTLDPVFCPLELKHVPYFLSEHQRTNESKLTPVEVLWLPDGGASNANFHDKKSPDGKCQKS